MQDKVVKLLLAISDGDGEEAALVLAGMGAPLDSYDAASFRADVSHLVSEAVSAGPGRPGRDSAGGVVTAVGRASLRRRRRCR